MHTINVLAINTLGDVFPVKGHLTDAKQKTSFTCQANVPPYGTVMLVVDTDLFRSSFGANTQKSKSRLVYAGNSATFAAIRQL